MSPRVSSRARSSGSPESCSTSSPCGATSSAARAGTCGTAPRSTPSTSASRASSTIRCSTLRRPSRPRHSPRKMVRAVMSDLFLDARGLAGEVAQVVELGAAHVAAALHGNLADRGAVGLEHALDALAVGDLAHREGGVQSAVAAGDYHPFVGLHALAVALDHLHLHDHGVSGPEVRDLARHARLVDVIDDLAHVIHLDLVFPPPVRPGTHLPRAAPRARAVRRRAGQAGGSRGAPPPARAASRGSRRERRGAAPPARAAPPKRPAAAKAAPPGGPAPTRPPCPLQHRR